MASLNNVLCNILMRKNDFCCLCFKTIGEDAIHVNDEVIFKLNDIQNNIEISEILSCVLGDELYNNISTFDGVCNQCTTSAINSYTFIKMCKENTQYLCDALVSLSTCFDNTSDEIEYCKTLFVSLNTKDFMCTQYYDYKRPVITRPAAFKRFRTMTNARHVNPKMEIKKEPEVFESDPNFKLDVGSIASTKGNDKPRIKLEKYGKRKTIPTTDMMYDKNDITNIKCKECFKTFNSQSDLRKHYIRVHAPKVFKCSECPRSYGSANLLEQHKHESHCTVVCSECGKTFHNRHTLKMHELGHKLRFVCQVCGRVYKNKDTFKNHIELNICEQTTRRSNSEAKFTCDICNKRYTQKNSLRVHIKFEHGNGNSHECMWCHKRFNAQSRLKAHIVKHTQEKKFNCELCGGKFVTKESLLYHTRRHTGEKPYQCQHCELRFLSASRRAEHVKRHHMTPTLECDVCQNKFKSKACLQKHKSRHFNPKSRLHYTLQISDSEEV